MGDPHLSLQLSERWPDPLKGHTAAPDRRQDRLVDADVHGLAGEPTSDEVPDQVPGDRTEPLGPGDEGVLTGEAAHQASLGVVVELGRLEDFGLSSSKARSQAAADADSVG